MRSKSKAGVDTHREFREPRGQSFASSRDASESSMSQKEIKTKNCGSWVASSLFSFFQLPRTLMEGPDHSDVEDLSSEILGSCKNLLSPLNRCYVRIIHRANRYHLLEQVDWSENFSDRWMEATIGWVSTSASFDSYVSMQKPFVSVSFIPVFGVWVPLVP